MATLRAAALLCVSKSGGVMLAPPRIPNMDIGILQWAAVQPEVVGTQVGIGYDISQKGAFIS